jgi:hypothetical protein
MSFAGVAPEATGRPAYHPATLGAILTKGKTRPDRRDDIDRYRNLTACATCGLKPRCTGWAAATS